MKGRIVLVYGQFGQLADPISLNELKHRFESEGFTVILIQHMDTRLCYDFLKDYAGFKAIIGSSLGAMSAVVFAGYLQPRVINFVGGFQPSDWDPSGHSVQRHLYKDRAVLYDTVTREITVPHNVKHALCFRNPVAAMTGGLGHASYDVENPKVTRLEIVERLDVHPGDFGEAQDHMFQEVMLDAKGAGNE